MTKNVVVKSDWTMYQHSANDYRSYPLPAPSSFPLSLALSTPGRAGFYIDYSELTEAGTHTFYVCRTHGTTGAVSVDYATSGDTHTAASGTLSWAGGEADIKTVTVQVSAADISTHDAAGLGEHRIVMTLSNPTSAALHFGGHTIARGVIDNDTMIASDTHALFIDFDAGTDGTGTATNPFNQWDSAREAWDGQRYIYMRGTGNSYDNNGDLFNDIHVFDNKQDGNGGRNIGGASYTLPLLIREWPGETLLITGGGYGDCAGFLCQSNGGVQNNGSERGNHTIFRKLNIRDINYQDSNAPSPGSAVNPGLNGIQMVYGGSSAPEGCAIELCDFRNIISGATSSTGAMYLPGGPIGLKAWRCTVQDIHKRNGTSPNDFEIFEAGSCSVQRCTFLSGEVHQKRSPNSGEIGLSVRFCVLNEWVYFHGDSGRPTGNYTIVQGNLFNPGTFKEQAILYDTTHSSTGEKHWVVGNVFNNRGGSNTYPITTSDTHSDQIIFNNIFYMGQGFWRLNEAGLDYELSDYNHDHNVANTGSWRYHYRGSEYPDTTSMNTVHGFETNMTTGDPLFTDLANDDVTLLHGSPCLTSGISQSQKGIYLTGAEVLGA